MSIVRISRVSAHMTKQSWDAPTKGEIKKVLQGAAVYGAGALVGSGLGYALRKKVLPKVLSQLNSTERVLVAGAFGAGGALAAAEAHRRLRDKSDAKRRKR